MLDAVSNSGIADMISVSSNTSLELLQTLSEMMTAVLSKRETTFNNFMIGDVVLGKINFNI
jgi:hypothetical protein